MARLAVSIAVWNDAAMARTDPFRLDPENYPFALEIGTRYGHPYTNGQLNNVATDADVYLLGTTCDGPSPIKIARSRDGGATWLPGDAAVLFGDELEPASLGGGGGGNDNASVGAVPTTPPASAPSTHPTAPTLASG